MTSFNVLATVDVLSQHYLHTAIEAYASFYKNLTPKHQAKISFTLFSQRYFSYLHDDTPLSELGMNIQIVCSSDSSETQDIFQKASVLFLPIMEAPGPIVKELLVCGLPLLVHRDSIITKHVDKHFSLISESRNARAFNLNHAIEDYAGLLDIFYFEPSVQKLMKKKANKKYRRKLNSGGYDISNLSFNPEKSGTLPGSLNYSQTT